MSTFLSGATGVIRLGIWLETALLVISANEDREGISRRGKFQIQYRMRVLRKLRLVLWFRRFTPPLWRMWIKPQWTWLDLPPFPSRTC